MTYKWRPMTGDWESRFCKGCDGDFIYPYYGNKICNNCSWKTRYERDRRNPYYGCDYEQSPSHVGTFVTVDCCTSCPIRHIALTLGASIV